MELQFKRPLSKPPIVMKYGTVYKQPEPIETTKISKNYGVYNTGEFTFAKGAGAGIRGVAGLAPGLVEATAINKSEQQTAKQSFASGYLAPFNFAKGVAQLIANAAGGAVLTGKEVIDKTVYPMVGKQAPTTPQSVNIPVLGEIGSYAKQSQNYQSQGFTPTEANVLVAISTYLGLVPIAERAIRANTISNKIGIEVIKKDLPAQISFNSPELEKYVSNLDFSKVKTTDQAISLVRNAIPKTLLSDKTVADIGFFDKYAKQFKGQTLPTAVFPKITLESVERIVADVSKKDSVKFTDVKKNVEKVVNLRTAEPTKPIQDITTKTPAKLTPLEQLMEKKIAKPPAEPKPLVQEAEIKRVSDNLLKNNRGITQRDAEAMARDLIENRKFYQVSKPAKETKPISKLPAELDPLIQEAKKYKTAEEFVKAQGTPKFYNVGDSFEMGKIIENPFKEGLPSVEKVQEINKYLQANKDKYNPKYVKFYHGTAKGLPIEEKGLLPTSATRRKSYQSESGYVYLANTPERAKTFGDLSNMSNSEVYEVVIPINKLLPDLDQLNNLRSTGEKIDNTLGDSIVYGGGVRIKGKIEPYAIRKLPESLKTKSELIDIWNKANKAAKEVKPISKIVPEAKPLPSETIVKQFEKLDQQSVQPTPWAARARKQLQSLINKYDFENYYKNQAVKEAKPFVKTAEKPVLTPLEKAFEQKRIVNLSKKQSIQKPIEQPTTKPSGVAKSIEAKAIEKGMIEKGYNELAGYEASTLKAQAEMGAKYSIDEIIKFVKGEEPLPKGMKPATPLSIVEDYAMKNNDGALMLELANSPLATQISEAASELSLTKIREKDSPVAQIKDVVKTRERAVEKKLGGKTTKKAKAEMKTSLKEKIKKTKPNSYDWNNFVNSIIC